MSVCGLRKVRLDKRMHLNWTDIAMGILGLYIFYAPFAYKDSRDKGYGHAGAALRMILGYTLFFLWIAGAASALYGLGMVIDRPAEYCGSGCIEEGEGHWEHPKLENLMVGLGLMAAGWIVGKAAEKYDGGD